MESENCKRVPSVPSNFLTLAQLQERWLQKKQREKQEEEEKARLQKQKEEEEEEERNRREKEDQQRKLLIQQTQKRENEDRERPRSNNSRPPFHRNRRNQCPAGDNELKPGKTHAGEVAAEEAELKSVRAGWKKRESVYRNRQNQFPGGGGAGDGDLKAEETLTRESVAEVAQPKIDESMYRRTGWKNRKPLFRNPQNQSTSGGSAGDDKLKPEETHIGEFLTEVVEPKIDVSMYRRTGWKNGKPYRNQQTEPPPGGGSGDGELKTEETHIGESQIEVVEPKIDVSMYRRTGWKNRKPSDQNLQNQCLPGGVAGDGERKPEETHIAESVAEVAEPKIDKSVYRRTGWKNRKPPDRNRQNQYPGGSVGDGEMKAEETHIGESMAEVADRKIDEPMYRRTGWKNRKPLDSNCQNRLPSGGSGDNEVKLGKTHIGEVAPEDVGLKIDDSIKKTGSKKRGKPRVQNKDPNNDLLPEIGANKEVGKGMIEKKQVWVDGCKELERKIEKISLCGGGGGGEGFNGRRSGYMRGGDNHHHQNYRADSGGFGRWHRKRNYKLVWVKKED